MGSPEPEKGDKVTWNWGGGQPGGTVAEKKTEGEVAITSKRGNKVKKNAEPNNPAVHIERSGQDVVKKASELNVEEKANGDAGAAKADDKEEPKEAETKNGEKRKHDDVEKDEKGEDNKQDKASPLEENAEGKTVKAKEPAAKKQKKEPAKKGGAPKEEPKKKEETKHAENNKKTVGQPKKAEGAPAKQKKEATPRATDGIGSRTRSQQKKA